MKFLISIVTALAIMIPIGCLASDIKIQQREYIMEAIKDAPMYISQSVKCDKDCNCWVTYGEDSPKIREKYREQCLGGK